VARVNDRLGKLEGDGPPGCEEQPCNGHLCTTEWAAVTALSCYLPPDLSDTELEARLEVYYEHFRSDWDSLTLGGFAHPDEASLEVKYLVRLKGELPPPMCEGCPLRGRYGAIYHLQVIHNAQSIYEKPTRETPLPSRARKAPHVLLAEEQEREDATEATEPQEAPEEVVVAAPVVTQVVEPPAEQERAAAVRRQSELAKQLRNDHPELFEGTSPGGDRYQADTHSFEQ
jgi:hypothetical protein